MKAHFLYFMILSLYRIIASARRSLRHSKKRIHNLYKVFMAVLLALLLIPLMPGVSRAGLIWYSAMNGTADPLVPDIGAITCAKVNTPTGGATGKFGTAWDFDAGDYLNCGATLPLSTDNFSVSAWAKIEASGNIRVILGIGSVALSGLQLYVTTTDTVTCNVVTGTNVSNDATSTATVNETGNVWTHLGCIKNGTSIKVCINGGEDGSATSVSSTMDYTDAANKFHLGARQTGDLNMLGQMDEVRIYNSVETCAGLYAINPLLHPQQTIIWQ